MTDPVYMLAQLVDADMDALMRDYVRPLQPINARHGAEVVFATPVPDVLEGTHAAGFTVCLRFPDRSAFDAWYADSDYAPLKAMRQRLTDAKASSVIVASAFASST